MATEAGGLRQGLGGFAAESLAAFTAPAGRSAAAGPARTGRARLQPDLRSESLSQVAASDSDSAALRLGGSESELGT
jgi:hypothetical protein